MSRSRRRPASDPHGRTIARLREYWEILAAQDQRCRAVGVNGDPPRRGRLSGISRAYDTQARHCPQGRELLDRLVGGASFAEAHRVVSEEVDDMGP